MKKEKKNLLPQISAPVQRQITGQEVTAQSSNNAIASSIFGIEERGSGVYLTFAGDDAE
ncbi:MULTISPECIES: anacyclamide/piricyclamide family prenylated cyclic peptide [Okeania]|uniref:Anacyclamide/piricyclamide family prenylated cyclic peptide n=1 Tax=Okeania hirsuta TaxID=1458930 RepID=A0A3N6P5F8_9CYAN|nr:MULTISPECIES: anacyclamide/piricyclamide family prenylated cyclic peptide [Okeania]NES91663.1 anacyclamide/piricyclamide family prenylated cyclic peptide [Okeania sp. SIO2B9]NET76362.1 anacyclamide/piricyclamide family prenylated cyclic peptide [Okeania sp. SIO1F9]RQH22386.1 anacyclamide/piricyclamide family prenylated cyclic peptide [Okeania hirsuta]RQH55461.1 anacyclamide/piricyclamide family prenylated cyclic peptide [Okeania hirsuta]